jgi:PAS domain S-box-containing protein
MRDVPAADGRAEAAANDPLPPAPNRVDAAERKLRSSPDVPMRTIRVLMLEDSRIDADLICARLTLAGFDCHPQVVDNEPAFRVALAAPEGWELILADFSLPGFSGIEALEMVRARYPEVPFIFVSGVLGEEHAVEMLKRGATDYVLKQRLERLPFVVERAIAEAAEREQRRQVESALRETETRYRLLIDALDDYAVITLDPDGNLRSWNKGAERIFRLSGENVIGRPAETIFSGVDAASFRRELADAASSASGSANDDRWLQRHDGSRFYAAGITAAIRDERGRLVGFSKIVRDITRAWQDAENLRDAKETAEAANQAKDQFLAVLSHELRTPLTPILTAVSLLELEDGQTAEARESLAVIRRNVELEARLIDDLLDLTRISRGKLVLNQAPADLHALVQGVIRLCEPDVNRAGLKLASDLRATDTSLFVDGARLQQILWNLLKNAVKFTPRGGTVTIRTSNAGGPGGRVEVSVSDTGIGIAPAALSRIFTAFEQGGLEVTRKFGGLGLGLTIATALAEMHDGTLRAESPGEGRGATFTLSLPTRSAGPVGGAAAAVPAPAARDGRPLRVLLVEDNRDTADVLRRLLERLGHRVRLAATRADAESVIRGGHADDADGFDLLISDIGLPDGTGHDVVRALRERRRTPAVALTGYGMEHDVARSREAGFDEHVTKPVDMAKLESVIRQVMG